MNKFSRNALKILAGILFLILVFAFDIYTPLGVADGMLYMGLILLTLFIYGTNYTIVAGLLASTLIIIGYFYSAGGGNVHTIAITNRLLSIISTWIAVALILVYKRSKDESVFYKERLKAFFEHAEEGILVVNEDENIVMANPKITHLFGYSELELKGKKVNHILPSVLNIEEGGKMRELDYSNFTSFTEKEKIFQARRKNSMIFPVTANIWNSEFSTKKYFIFFILDITEKILQEEALNQALDKLVKYSGELEKTNSELEARVEVRTTELRNTVKELEFINSLIQQEIMNKEEAVSALKESQLMLETIALNFPNGMMSVLDRDFRYLYAHGQEINNLGLSQEELIGSLFLPLRNEKVHDEVKEILMKNFQGEKISFEYQNPDTHTYYLFNAAPLPNSDNETSQVLVVSQNITALKKAEYEIRKSLERERELNDMKSRFVSMASHEFRTPLAAILSSASLISKYNNPGDDPKRSKHIERITSSVSNLTEILNDFLSLGKTEEGKVHNRPVEFDIVDLCEDIMEEVGVMTKPEQEIKLNYKMDSKRVSLDKQLLRNILLNLLSNAIKYSTDGTIIYLDVVKQDGEILFTIKDQGIGIPQADQKHLFETFSRASNVENIKGTGMGLHIVKKYLDIMNGCIEYESDLNKGSRFTVKFNA